MQYELIKIDPKELEKFKGLKNEFSIDGIEVDNDKEYSNLAELLKKVKGKSREVKLVFTEPKQKAYENHKEISSTEKEYLEHLSKFEKLAKKSIGDYQLRLEKQDSALNPIQPPKVKGISSSSKYKWELVDIDKVDSKYLMVELNEKLIKAMVESTNGSIEIEGIRIYEEKQISVKGWEDEIRNL